MSTNPYASLDDLVAFAADYGGEQFARHSEVIPTWIGVPEVSVRPVLVIATPWRDEHDKVAALAALRAAFRLAGVVCYALITEVWLAEVDPRTQPELRKVQPKDRADRREAVTVLAVKRGRPPKQIMREIVRRCWLSPEGRRVGEALKIFARTDRGGACA